MKKVCSKCNIEKDGSDYRKDKSKSDGLQSFCKVCAREFFRSGYTERYGEKSRARMRLRIASSILLIQEYKATQKCLCCKESDPVCLEFHHIDPNEKEFGIANGLGNNWDKILKEIEKCVVLCSNCHKKVHAGKLFIPVD